MEVGMTTELLRLGNVNMADGQKRQTPSFESVSVHQSDTISWSNHCG